ncbi:MAG: 50S ribosomal protein L28 [Candidatus Kerfeldbacteria bacterium CG15_BIG_FIL_POST_REV_8_21_14_020_45_12]|uniref:Large ribosomal subunit protein bL28 n=1 Tax=Candidatus Kerfeldbacteria bacterium CG15_BIG_FIL_POST_REV_8_21_14_020_45_12 TaxID=2014247 RepID=A0A2M7H4Y5_9BACT|nr:MAG: 50S ribosomal protein L28 [Candidatus Kerfeldbacteria bacterium CG15_BIG_FIL_POST_REV_8_21_14_020_45_12]PJA93677.1 MAG: 50S ribosomal protein L28 [Candidatus Kerfeldbacteria bacterium CG_4_9_14_3_um_filter_45_8]
MGRVCQITGKRFLTGNNVSHSQRKTKKRTKPNLQKKRLMNPATGQKVTVLVSTSALRTLQKWDENGTKYDLLELMD